MLTTKTAILALAPICFAACSTPTDPTPPPNIQPHIELDTLAPTQTNVFGFEDPTLWTSTASLSSSTTHTQGTLSLGVSAKGYTTVTSVALSALSNVSGTLSVDILLPAAQPNPSWYGAIQLYVSVPSKNVYSAYLGQQELTGKPLSQFFRLDFTVPQTLVTTLKAGGYNDLTVQLVINVPTNATGVYLLDNLRFFGCTIPCGTHSTCNQTTLTCDCDLGYAGSDCTGCAAGFQSQSGTCVLSNDGVSSTWPNAFSKANSDPWLAVHHDQIQLVKPNVLALLYANPGTYASETALVQSVANGFSQGSRTQAFKSSSAPIQLQYQITSVDLRDGVNGRPPAPAGFPYQNSTLFPRKTEPDGSLRFDYAALFRSNYAANFGYPDPAHPGQFLDLCSLVNQGTVHEVWVVASGDVPDASALEVGGTMANYTASGNQIPGSFSRCANGCVDDDVPFCGRTIRVGFVNYNRGPGCFLHSKGHDIEFGFENSVPQLKEWFRPFARFDLDTRYGLPFANLYGLGCTSPPCLGYPSPTHAHFVFGSTPYDVDPFDPVCGDVHFPPNGVSNYDYFNTSVQVQSSCTGFGRHAGAGGADASELIGGSVALPWSAPAYAPYNDCGGEFLVWWYQNMPGQASGQTFGDGRIMKSIWPFLFY